MKTRRTATISNGKFIYYITSVYTLSSSFFFLAKENEWQIVKLLWLIHLIHRWFTSHMSISQHSSLVQIRLCVCVFSFNKIIYLHMRFICIRRPVTVSYNTHEHSQYDRQSSNNTHINQQHILLLLSNSYLSIKFHQFEIFFCSAQQFELQIGMHKNRPKNLIWWLNIPIKFHSSKNVFRTTIWKEMTI